MTLIVYGLKACDGTRKAIKTLEAAGKSVTLHDVRADGLPEALLRDWVAALGWKALLNTRSTTWRGLDAGEKESIDEERAIGLMLAHPALVKRPVVDTGSAVVIGAAAALQ